MSWFTKVLKAPLKLNPVPLFEKGMDRAMKAMIAGILRHVITAATPTLIAAGYIESSQSAEFIGACVFLAGVVWSVIEKRQKN